MKSNVGVAEKMFETLAKEYQYSWISTPKLK